MIEFEKTINIINMLKSPDLENRVMGLVMLDKLKHQDNDLPLMLCWKLGCSVREEWQENAPIALSWMQGNIFGSTTQITVKKLFQEACAARVSTEYMEYVTDHLAEVMQEIFTLKGKIKISIEYEE